jgi:hypothetical protein
MYHPAYPRHPAAEIFDPLEGKDFMDLVASMKQHGFLPGQEVVLYEGKVLDGWNRQRAADLAGIEPRYRQWESKVDPVEYVVAVNLTRRHLSLIQKAEAAGRLLEKLQAEARKRQQRGKSSDNGAADKGKAADLAGRRFGISGDTVSRMQKIKARATPRLLFAARSESLPLAVAAKIAELPPDQQEAALEANQLPACVAASFKISTAARDMIERLSTRLNLKKSTIVEEAVFLYAKTHKVS